MRKNWKSKSNKQITGRMFEAKASRCFIAIPAILMVLICVHSIRPTGAILNCFNPNMFKMGKGGHQVYGANVGERANWYPQQQYAYSPMNYGYAQNPMKMLFQPKWKQAGGLFGPKMGWNSWKMNQNFYRPNYANMVPSAIPTPAGYQFNEQLNVAPITLPSPVRPYSSGSSAYSMPIVHNDGWSAIPSYQQPIQQNPLTNYDTTSYASPLQPATKQPLVDPYSIKGGSQKSTTTKNNILLADGGYNVYDSYLTNLKNQSYGYSYPTNWYSAQQQTIADSPARIAQQLFKYNLRKHRLESGLGFGANRSAPLIQQSPIAIANTQLFAILDEPRFVGFGNVEELSNKEARLSCSFNEAIDKANQPIWIKFTGPYNTSQIINGKNIPPFNCVNSQCRTQTINTINEDRIKLDNGPATSTLIIREPRLADYGIYRCSALTKSLNNNPLEIIYQIVRFGSLK